MERYSLAKFVESTAEKPELRGFFELESSQMLEVNLRGAVWMKLGTMVAFQGPLKFTRERAFEHGLGLWLKRLFSGEGARLAKAEGIGRLYLADRAKKVTVLHLEGESLYVNGNDLLAFEPSLKWDIRMMRRVSAMMAGGLFNVRFEGAGAVALTSHGQPLALRVEPGKPVRTDPHATVAWSGHLEPSIRTDVSLRTFLGRGGGEAFQLEFTGSGFVVVQPYEERTAQRARSGSPVG